MRVGRNCRGFGLKKTNPPAKATLFGSCDTSTRRGVDRCGYIRIRTNAPASIVVDARAHTYLLFHPTTFRRPLRGLPPHLRLGLLPTSKVDRMLLALTLDWTNNDCQQHAVHNLRWRTTIVVTYLTIHYCPTCVLYSNSAVRQHRFLRSKNSRRSSYE